MHVEDMGKTNDKLDIGNNKIQYIHPKRSFEKGDINFRTSKGA